MEGRGERVIVVIFVERYFSSCKCAILPEVSDISGCLFTTTLYRNAC